mgnify:FL=1
MIFHWFKYKVPVDRHGSEIIIRMLSDGLVVTVRQNFWDYLKKEFGIKQYFNWRNCTNYMVFRNEQHYLTFLLKL